jgi:molecular chaperone GrpE
MKNSPLNDEVKQANSSSSVETGNLKSVDMEVAANSDLHEESNTEDRNDTESNDESANLIDKIAALEALLEQAKSESKAASHDALKHLAELENFKKRKQQEVESFKKYAIESVVLEVLAVLDTFELACQIPETQKENESLTQFIQGFELILKQFYQTLDRLHVTAFDPTNEPFDPEVHQAVSQEKSETVSPNHVIRVMKRGYRLYDKLIRPAMVVVAS